MNEFFVMVILWLDTDDGVSININKASVKKLYLSRFVYYPIFSPNNYAIRLINFQYSLNRVLTEKAGF